MRAVTRQPRLLDTRAQDQPALELYHDLRLPGRRARRRVIHVEVVLILPGLDEELEVSVLPPRAPAACPDTQRAVLQEILVAFARKAQIRFGPLPEPEPMREHTHRPLVDFGGPDLKCRTTAASLVGDARRRCIAEVLVIRADDRCDDFTESRAAIATDAQYWCVAALHPRAADEPHTGQGE